MICKNNCKNNCCSVFCGISDKISPIDNYSFSDIILTKNDINLLIEHGLVEYIDLRKDMRSKLKTSIDGVCSALSNGECLIYPYRPTVCRAYPLYIDMFSGMCSIDECLLAPKNLDVKNNSYEIRAIIEVYQEWVEYYKSILDDL